MAKPRTKVLHVFGRMNRGGAEMRTLDIMRSLDPSEYQLDFCVLSGLPGDLDDEIARLGGSVHFCKMDFAFPFRFIKLLRYGRFHAVHSHVLFVSGYVLFLAWMSGIPTRIAHFRTTAGGVQGGRLRAVRDAFLRLLVDRFATDIVAVSAGTMEACWGRHHHLDSRCRVIYNGVNVNFLERDGGTVSVREEFNISKKGHLYIHVGRFSPAKNHLRLISIFRETLRIDNSGCLLLVGEGDSEIEMQVREKISGLGITQSVRFAGLRSDVPRLMKAADAMIFPSLWEGLPGAVLEACAVGTPVLASDVTGVVEIASHFPYVSYLSLDEDDEKWARMLIQTIQERPDPVRQDKLFQDSKFTLERSTNDMKEIWA